MPLAFASILGGMNTKIGTPPNIIISEIRGEYSNSNFNFFDFSYVGIPVCIVGILFIAIIGWRLIQIRPINTDNNNLIELSDSPWSSRVIFVEKNQDEKQNKNDRNFPILPQLPFVATTTGFSF